jgi:hypothetical protein
MDWTVLVIAIVAAVGAYIGAYFSERGKINAQTAALEKIVRQETAKAMGQEQGKNLARKEDLDAILAEVRAVTVATKEIEAKISGELWYRQMHWTEKKDLYGQLVKNVNELLRHLNVVETQEEPNEVGLNKIMGKLNAANHELLQLWALAMIFANVECQTAIRNYIERRPSIEDVTQQWAKTEITLLSRLFSDIITAARADLRIVDSK